MTDRSSRVRMVLLGLLAGFALTGCQDLFSPDVPNEGDTGDALPAAGAPTFAPTGGTFEEDIEVALSSATSGTEVYYTLDGNDPEPGSAGTELFDPAAPIVVSGDGTSATITAVAVGDGHSASPVVSESYTIAYLGPSGPEPGIRHVATESDGGNDSTGNGSRAAPFATIHAAIADLSSTDGEREVRVAGGVYPYAFMSLTLEQGILVKGGYNPQDWTERDPRVWETIIDGDNTRWTVRANGIAETPRTGLDGVTVLAHTGYTGVTINYAVYIWNSAITITNSTIQGGRADSSGTTALEVSGTTSGILRTTTVEGSTISVTSAAIPMRSEAVNVYQNGGGGANVTIRTSTIETGPASNASEAITINDGPGALTVEENTITVGNGTNSSTAILLSQGSSHVVRGNTVTLGVSPDSVGVSTYYSDDVVIEENTLIAPSDDGSGSTIGIETGGGSSLAVRNNVVQREAGGSQRFVGISARTDVLVDNNTVASENGDGEFVAISTDRFGLGAANPSVRNNIVVSTVANDESVGLQIPASSTQTDTTPLVLQNNLFHGLGTLVSFGGTEYTDPADLNVEANTTARAAGSADANLVADPSFAIGEFHLTASSPAAAREGGLDLSGDGVVLDRDGVTRTADGSGTGYSMGAYEF